MTLHLHEYYDSKLLYTIDPWPYTYMSTYYDSRLRSVPITYPTDSLPNALGPLLNTRRKLPNTWNSFLTPENRYLTHEAHKLIHEAN